MNKSNKIKSKNIQDILALTPLQEGILFHYLKDPLESTYLNQLSLELSGDIHLQHFEDAWNFVIKSNEMLRTVFRWEKLETPTQVVLERHSINLKFEDLSKVGDSVEQKKQWENIKQQDRLNQFDLREVPFRVLLVKMSQYGYQMLISNHHILYDGWSTGIILKEFSQAYDALAAGFQPPVPQVKSRFKNFIRWHQVQNSPGQKKYWQNYLEGFDSPTRLPVKRSQPDPGSPGLNNYRLHLSQSVKNKLEGLVKEKRITLAAVFYCAWGLLLQKYCNSEDVAFGITVSGRLAPIKGIEDMVGLFINTIPFRARFDPCVSLVDSLVNINNHLAAGEKYEYTPLVDIYECCRIMHVGEELFDTLVSIENYPLDFHLKVPGSHLSFRSYEMGEHPHYDLTLVISIDEGIDIDFIYNSNSFDKETIVRLAHLFSTILKCIVENAGYSPQEIEILSDIEKQQLLIDFNRTASDYPKEKSIYELFEEQVERAPDNIALHGSMIAWMHGEAAPRDHDVLPARLVRPVRSVRLTYRDLNERSNRLAYILIEKGVQPDTIVGIIVERSVEMIIGILGILKSHGAYLPIDPDYPQERIDYMLKDSGTKILLTRQDIPCLFSPQALNLSEGHHLNFPASQLPIFPDSLSSNLAYVIYTSGSTGRPKGVMIQHRSVVNFMKGMADLIDFRLNDTILSLTTISFDIFGLETIVPLICGSMVVMGTEAEQMDPKAAVRSLDREKVTIFQVTPSRLRLFLSYGVEKIFKSFKRLRYLLVGGEAFPENLLEQFKMLVGGKIYNMYGPTETTIWSTVKDLTGTTMLTIGKPIANTCIYILDNYLKLVPINVSGDLYIGGAGLARGYINNPGLTNEKFKIINYKLQIQNGNGALRADLDAFGDKEAHDLPLRAKNQELRAKLYKTGDLARWLSDGNIEFLGRIDSQVKIRGFRVELGEIENRLLNYPGIKEVVALAQKEDRGEGDICVYIVSDSEKSIPALREFLSIELPDYMIPSYFIQIEEIPLTPNGKIDRKALPKPDFKVGESFTAPGNEIEKKLVDIWSGVLGIEKEKIGINDNFFHLGGHSLKATILASRIHKELKVNVPLPEIFKTLSIRGLAAFIKNVETQGFFSIEAVEKKEYHPLSSTQERLHFLQQMEPESKVYHMPAVMILLGELDRRKLEEIFKRLIERHESLRTSFIRINDETMQRIHEKVEFKIEYYNLTTDYTDYLDYTDYKEKNYKLQITNKEVPYGQVLNSFGEDSSLTQTRDTNTIIKEFIRPFDLSKAPLLRVGLIKLTHNPATSRNHRHFSQEGKGDKHLLMVDMHHIIADGTSIGILRKEAMALYRGIDLPSLRIHYKEYVGWQKSKKNREALSTQEKFWLLQFEKEIPVLNLPTDYAKPLVQSFEGDHLYFELSGEKTLSLKNLMRKQEVTLFMILLAICNTWFSKLSGSEDIVIGSPIASRRHADLQDIIGMFVNTLALRNYPEPGKTFSDFLKEVKARTLEAFQNQDYQFEDLVDRLVSDRDTSRNPVFDAMFVFQNMEMAEIEIPGLVLIPHEYENKTSKFDLNLSGMEKEGKLAFDLEYSTKLFKEETVWRFIAYFKNIINFILENPEARISDVEIMSEEEKERILATSNGIAVPIDAHETIHEMFEKIVKGNEDKTALVLGDSRVTYGDLNRRANRLAYVLRNRGIRLDSTVGLMLERSFQLVIGILAILKAGGAYLPIDSDYPWERKKYMLLDSEVSMLLTDYDIEDTAGLISNKIDVISPGDEDIYSQEEENSGHNTDGSNLVYLIYTSGSTGEPKGIMMEHRSLVNLLAYQFIHTVIPFKRVLQFTTISFDVSFQEIFSTLLTGGILYLVDKETRNDILVLFEVINKNEIETLFLPASFLKFVMNEKEYIGRMPTAVRHIVTAGEQVVVSNRFRIYLKENRVCLHNHYGPAETHVVTTLTLDPGGEIPELPSIGKPISNTGIYILDKARHLQPVGINGELFIGGDCLSRGYLNQPGLTGEKFKIINYKAPGRGNLRRPFGPSREPLNCDSQLPVPYAQLPKHHSHYSPLTTHHSPLYQTGDLGRWREDGNIEFLGRIDSQVKIRGFRVELGEIESKLLKHSEIREVVVVSREEKRGMQGYLCGYFVADRYIPPGDLREFLSKILPDYMIPSYFVQLEKIPTTPNGKIDRKALPVPVVKASDKYEAPGNEIEKKLVEIWSGVLGIEEEKIGINDNFFHLGGHSLKATALVSRVSKELGVKVPLTEIFIKPYIRRLAAFVKNAETLRFFSIEAVEKKEYYILSSAQRRLLVLQQMDEKGITYNMPSVWQLEGELNVEKFEAVFQQLIQRHESLRTSFHIVNDEPMQRIHEENYKLQITNKSDNEGTRGLAPLPDKPATLTLQSLTVLISSFIRPFDLVQAPLLRVDLIKAGDEKYILMVDMHHIISDGMSIGILVREFMELYAGKRLPVLRLQYKDYSEWQKRHSLEKTIKQQEAYWLKEFSGEIPVLELPLDYPRPAVQEFTGCSISFEIDQEETNALKSLADEQGVTLFMLLLSLYTVCLSRLCSQEDIVVGTPIAGRRHADLEPLMGMFVNTLVLWSLPLGPKFFNQFLTEVKENTIKAFENQDYLYEDLVEQMEVERDSGRNPLFDIMFSLQNMDTPAVEIPGLKIASYHYENRISKFDLTLTAVEKEDRLAFTFEYCTGLFKEETVRRFIGFFKKIVSFVLENIDIKISEIEIINVEEKNKILYTFNDTGAEYPRDKTIHQLFEEQVERTPDNIALHGCMIAWMHGEEGSITYKELNEKSNRMVHFLKEKGIQPDTIVGIKVERSTEMIIGILGILKSGGAYLPIDPDYPEERIDFMLKDSNVGVLVTTPKLQFKVNAEVEENCRQPLLPLQFIETKAYPAFASEPSPSTLASTSTCQVSPTNLTYIIYTSGSTGHPKGVMVNHGSVVNLLFALHSRYPLTKQDTYLLKTSYLFDVSVSELFGWFLEGGRLTVLKPGGEKDPGIILDTIERSCVTHINFVPSMFQVFTRALEHENNGKLSSLKYIFLAGEALLPRVVQRFRHLNTGIVSENIYGPTEAAVYSSWYSLADWQPGTNVPIGKPLPNVKLYILDENEHLKPIGIAGELCIGGPGLSRGYLNKPGLTKEKFLHLTLNTKHLTLYKTGDLARWLLDGNIEFLGRIDHQVKIRGFRIELGEIENQLLTHEKIKEAIVIAREDNNDKFLCAYIVPKSIETKPIDQSGLREYLSNRLPDYMVPSYFVQLDKIPLTPNGKVDRKALPEPEIKTGEHYTAPRNEIEKKLVDIWSGVLGIEKEKIGINDNFFHLRGHSLKAILLAARIHRKLNINIPLLEIFRMPVLKDLADYIKKKAAPRKYISIEPAEMKEYYNLSSAQKRLYVLQQMDLTSTSYNMSNIFALEGNLNLKKFEKVFHDLVNRHEAFRTSFCLVFDRVMQKLDDKVKLKISYKKLSSVCTEEDLKNRMKEFVKPFDLNKAPLLRIELIELNKEKHLVLFDMHHIIADGTSTEILAKDFAQLYEGKHLASLPIQYKDYAEWQNSGFKNKEKINVQEEYWLNTLEGLVFTQVPMDHLDSYSIVQGRVEPLEISAFLYHQIEKFCHRHNITIFVFMITVFEIVLAREINQTDIAIGIPVSLREHSDLRDVIGIFLNILLIRSIINEEDIFLKHLLKVKKTVIQALNNRDYPYEMLNDKIRENITVKHNELFSILFNYFPMEVNKIISAADFEISPMKNPEVSPKYDMTIYIYDNHEHMVINVVYKGNIYGDYTIKRLLDDYLNIIQWVLENENMEMSELPPPGGYECDDWEGEFEKFYESEI